MQSREMNAKARFAMLIDALPKNLILVQHVRKDKEDTFSLQVVRSEGNRQWSVPIAEIYTGGAAEEVENAK